jgi:type II secretory pathway component PulM
LRYTDFIAPMVKAIQEQQAIIDELKARLSEIDRLKVEIAELKRLIGQ